jgi:hypothetical protein
VASPLSVLLLLRRDLRQARYYAAPPCVRRSCAPTRVLCTRPPARTHGCGRERTSPRPCAAATTGNLVTDHDTHDDDKQVGEVSVRTYMHVVGVATGP